MTDGAWRRRLGGDPLAIGRTIGLSGEPATIVGVLPRDFEFPLRGLAELFLPLRPTPAQPNAGTTTGSISSAGYGPVSRSSRPGPISMSSHAGSQQWIPNTIRPHARTS